MRTVPGVRSFFVALRLPVIKALEHIASAAPSPWSSPSSYALPTGRAGGSPGQAPSRPTRRWKQLSPASSRVCGRHREENRQLQRRWRLAGQGQDCKTTDLEAGWNFIQRGINKGINVLEVKPEPEYMMLYT